jgi:hypothetical protein
MKSNPRSRGDRIKHHSRGQGHQGGRGRSAPRPPPGIQPGVASSRRRAWPAERRCARRPPTSAGQRPAARLGARRTFADPDPSRIQVQVAASDRHELTPPETGECGEQPQCPESWGDHACLRGRPASMPHRISWTTPFQSARPTAGLEQQVTGGELGDPFVRRSGVGHTSSEEIDPMIDGPIGWDGASQSSPFAEFLMMAPEGDEVVPMFQPLLRGEPVPVNGADAVAGHPGFGCRAQSRRPIGAPDRQLTFQLSRAAAARSAVSLTSSGWMPGTAAMAPFDSRVSGAPA